MNKSPAPKDSQSKNPGQSNLKTTTDTPTEPETTTPAEQQSDTIKTIPNVSKEASTTSNEAEPGATSTKAKAAEPHAADGKADSDAASSKTESAEAAPNSEVTESAAGSGTETQVKQSTEHNEEFSLRDIAIGQKDPRGLTVTNVYWWTSDYVIFQAGGRISPMFSDDPAKSGEQRKSYMQLGQSLARINTLEPGRAIRRSKRRWFEKSDPGVDPGEPRPSPSDFFNREVARAIALCFEDMREEANALLKELEQKIVNRMQIKFRTIYLCYSFLAMVLYVLFVLATTYDTSLANGWIAWLAAYFLPGDALNSFVSTSVPLLRATAIAAIASFFSVSLGIRSLQFDVDTMSARGGTWFTVLLSSSRIVIGIIASLFIFLAIKSGAVFGLTLDEATTSERLGILYVLAFLSGFSEQFVPNVLKNVETQTTVKVPGGTGGGGSSERPTPDER